MFKPLTQNLPNRVLGQARSFHSHQSTNSSFLLKRVSNSVLLTSTFLGSRTSLQTTLAYSPCLTKISWRSFSTEEEEEDIELSQAPPHYATFVKNVRATFRTKDVTALQKVFDEAVSGGLEVNNYTWRTMISAASKLRSEEKMLEYFQKAGEVDIWLYNALINGYLRLKNPERVQQLVQQLLSQGLEPNEQTFNSLLKLAIRNRDFKKAEDLFNEYKAKQFPVDKYHFINLLNYSIALGNEEEFDNLISQIKEKNLFEDDFLRNSIFDGYARFKRWDEILHEYLSLKQKKKRISSISYGFALEAAANQSDVEQMDAILKDIEQNKIFKTVEIFNALMKGYSKGGQFDKAWKIFERLAQPNNRTKPNVKSYNIILTACGFAHQGEKIEEIINLMNKLGFQQNSSISASIIAAYVKNRDLSRAVQALMDMQEKGISWEAKHKNALVLNLKTGDYPEKLTDNVNRLASSSKNQGPLQQQDLTEFQNLIKGLRM